MLWSFMKVLMCCQRSTCDFCRTWKRWRAWEIRSKWKTRNTFNIESWLGLKHLWQWAGLNISIKTQYSHWQACASFWNLAIVVAMGAEMEIAEMGFQCTLAQSEKNQSGSTNQLESWTWDSAVFGKRSVTNRSWRRKTRCLFRLTHSCNTAV